MCSSHKHSSTILHHYYSFISLFLSALIVIAQTQAQALDGEKGLNNSVPAIFVFGDSTVDPGNNNYIGTIFRSNFRPYGRDFPNQVPTGRFSNGLLSTDFIARYLGIKEFVPPYLGPTLGMEELMTGVSFATGGSGFDPLTPRITSVLSMSKQLEYFKEYQKRAELVMGKERTKKLIKDALYFVSAGTNDFIANYFGLQIRKKSYSLPSYMEFLLQHVQQFLQGLLDQGARRIGIVGLPPMGCLPAIITVNSANAILQRGCVEFFSSVAGQYNSMLQIKLNSIQQQQHGGLSASGVKITYMDAYGPLSDMINQSSQFNFEEVSTGCCGTGLLEVTFLCNPKSYVCSDASKYVFWDSIHPTEKTYELLSQAFQSAVDFLIKD